MCLRTEENSQQQSGGRRDCSFSETAPSDQKPLKACISNYICNYKNLNFSFLIKFECWSSIRTSRTELEIKCHLLTASEKIIGLVLLLETLLEMHRSVGWECQPLLDTDHNSGSFHAAFGILSLIRAECVCCISMTSKHTHCDDKMFINSNKQMPGVVCNQSR